MVLVQKVETRSYGRGASTVVEGVGVTSIAPDTGSVNGETDVTITGTNFTGTPTVTIGGNSASNIVRVNSTTITCTTAAHAAGVVDVVVDGSGAGNQLFTFVAQSASPLIFASDFSTATGTSAANPDAVTDGGRWDGLALEDDEGSGLEVVASTGLDFPSTNVLKVTAKDTNSTGAASFLRIFKELPSAPGEGESIWYRLYIRHMQPLSQSHFSTGAEYDEANHPIELGYDADPVGAGGEDLTLHCETFSDTQWRIGTGVTALDGVNFTYSRWYSPLLEKDTTYRVEWQVARLTGLNINLHWRIYDHNDNLLYEDNVFRGRGLAASPTLADNPTLEIEAVHNLQEFCAGLNGLGGSYWWPSELYQYQGCFAVSLTDWCGVYVPGEAEGF